MDSTKTLCCFCVVFKIKLYEQLVATDSYTYYYLLKLLRLSKNCKGKGIAKWNDIYTWPYLILTLDKNLLTLNTKKTKYIPLTKTVCFLCVSQPPHLGLKIHYCFTDPLIRLSSCSSFDDVNSVRYLGITIDKNLSHKQHISEVSNRTRKLIHVMKNIRECAPMPLLKQIYVALCQFIIQYCITIWGSTGKTVFMAVERAQRALIKVLLWKPFLFPTDQLYA